MADSFKVGDRVTLTNGQSGTVVRVSGTVLDVLLSSGVCMTTWAFMLKKVRRTAADGTTGGV